MCRGVIKSKEADVLQSDYGLVHQHLKANPLLSKKRKTFHSKSTMPRKSVETQCKSPKLAKVNAKSKADDMSSGRGKFSAKKVSNHAEQSSRKQSGKGSSKATCNSKTKLNMCSQKKKASKNLDTNKFIDIFSLVTIGKREASLNATMKVNILYERHTSLKKVSPTKSLHSVKEEPKSTLDSILSSPNSSVPSSATVKKEERLSRPKEKKSVKKAKISNKKSDHVVEKKKNQQNRKRKVSPYTIFEDQPTAKSRKCDNNKQAKTKNKKQPKKRNNKSFALRHHLGNIIERSPRQASLNAKARIAMEQEENTVTECAARTRIYDWTEVRPFPQNEFRKMIWMTGHGDPKYTNIRNVIPLDCEKIASCKESLPNEWEDQKINGDVNGNLSDSSIHSTVLKTIHEIGDPRLLREYLRSQKEDIECVVDVEKCPSPSPKPVEKVVPHLPSPKKKTPPALLVESPEKYSCKKNEKEKTGKTGMSSPAKSMPFRVATPIPQFPVDQRATHMTSFVHQPTPQSFYQPVQQQQPQPIKVTPYAPNPAFIYQYSSPDRQQQNLFMQNNPPAMQYGVESNDLSQRDYQPSSFSFNHMGSLSLGRRGLNPYHQSSAYSPSIHLPMQAFGFNFPAAQYYQTPLQHLQAHQNLSTLQSVPLQQYPQLVQQPVISPHQLVQNLNQLPAYQPGFSPYANMNTQHMYPDHAKCMPPPPTPRTSNTSPQKESPKQDRLPPTKPSIRVASPSSKCVKSLKVADTPKSPMKMTNAPHVSKYPVDVAIQKPLIDPGRSLLNANHLPGHSKSSLSTPLKHSMPIQVLPIHKKEYESSQSPAKRKTASGSNNVPGKEMNNLKAPGESSTFSDILHSAHSTMYPSEDLSSSERHPSQPVVSSSMPSSQTQSSQTQTARVAERGKNICFSVSSILDMPAIKMKTEPPGPSCPKGAIKILQGGPSNARGPPQPGPFFICIPPPSAHMNNSKAKHPILLRPAQSLLGCNILGQKSDKEAFKNRPTAFKAFLSNNNNNPDKVIIIDDSDSSDDEPLAKLIQSKSAQPPCSVNVPTVLNAVPSQNKTGNAKLTESPKVQSKATCTDPRDVEVETILNAKQCKEKASNCEQFTQLQVKPPTELNLKSPKFTEARPKIKKQVFKKALKKMPSEKLTSNSSKISSTKQDTAGDVPRKEKVVKRLKSQKKCPARRKSKTDVSHQPVKPAVHGWSWVGEGEWRPIPKLTQQKEELVRQRMCYKSMKHTLGEVISVKDCVILQSDGDGSAPYVAKVSALWENMNGDMMFSMLWYYQPEHTSTDRESEDGEQELFASKHREENSVACIDDKCYVLMYNEFCRMEAEAVRLAHGLPLPRWRELIPGVADSDKKVCRPLPPPTACLDNIWFCRYDYDFRKKIVRKPKHKKTDLRYRAPCKLV